MLPRARGTPARNTDYRDSRCDSSVWKANRWPPSAVRPAISCHRPRLLYLNGPHHNAGVKETKSCEYEIRVL